MSHVPSLCLYRSSREYPAASGRGFTPVRARGAARLPTRLTPDRGECRDREGRRIRSCDLLLRNLEEDDRAATDESRLTSRSRSRFGPRLICRALFVAVRPYNLPSGGRRAISPNWQSSLVSVLVLKSQIAPRLSDRNEIRQRSSPEIGPTAARRSAQLEKERERERERKRVALRHSGQTTVPLSLRVVSIE